MPFLMINRVCRIDYVANNNNFKVKIIECNIESSHQEKLVGVILDDQLNFKRHRSA